MTLISCDATFPIRDLIDVGHTHARARARPPRSLSLKPVLPSCYRHHHSDMKGEKQVLPLPRRNLDLWAFAFVTYNHRVYERVTMALSDWMALRKGGGVWHSAAQDGPPASPTFAPSSRRCRPRLSTLGGSLPCWLLLLSRWILWCLWPIYRNRTWKNT